MRSKIWIVEPIPAHVLGKHAKMEECILPGLSDFERNSKDKKWHRCHHVLWDERLDYFHNAMNDCSISDESSESECRHIKAVLKMQEAITGLSLGDVYIRVKKSPSLNSFTKSELTSNFMKLI